jgi:hypothetical protein
MVPDPRQRRGPARAGQITDNDRPGSIARDSERYRHVMTTTPRIEPAKRLTELLESLPAEERKEITTWLLGQRTSRPAAAFVSGMWPHVGEAPTRVTSSLPVGEDNQLVTIRLPADRHAQLRAWCAEHGFTMAAVVRGLIERFLEQQERAGARG